MTNKFVIIFIILAGIFTAWFGTQTVQAGCTEYWDCPTNNYCDICDPPKTKDSGSCVSNGTPHRTDCNSAPTPTPNNGGGTPTPTPNSNPGSCGGVPCYCGASKCDTHSTNNGVDYVCLRGVDNGYPDWACSSGVWVRSGVSVPPPSTPPTPRPTSRPTPAPTSAPGCNSGCVINDDCDSGFVCSSRQCRNSRCVTAGNCNCSTPTNSPAPTSRPTATPAPTPPTNSWCNKSCTVQNSNSDCPYGFTCNGTGCRNSSCVTKTDCVCSAPTPTPKPTPTSKPTPTPTVIPTLPPQAWAGCPFLNKTDCESNSYYEGTQQVSCVWYDCYHYNGQANGCYGRGSMYDACRVPIPTVYVPYCMPNNILCLEYDYDAEVCKTGKFCDRDCIGQPGDAECAPTPSLSPTPAPTSVPTPAPTPFVAKTPYCTSVNNSDEKILCLEYDYYHGYCKTPVPCAWMIVNGEKKITTCQGPDGHAQCLPTSSTNGVVITGKVQGSIISNALIVFFAGGKKVQEVTTDAVGNFSLTLDQKAIEENTEFVITVEKQGYKTFKTTWRPGQGVSYFMQIQLEKGDVKDNGGQANINAQGVSYQLDAGWNFVSINLQSEINTASKLVEAINNQGGQVVFVSRWLGDRWESYVPNAGSADFAVEPGKSYMIKVGKKSEFTLSGNSQKNSSTTVEKGWNAVSFPLLEKQAVTADGKLKALNGSIISRFSSGLWDTYARLGNPIQVYGNDYELDSRQGYFVKVE